jgi:hypothetical protein
MRTVFLIALDDERRLFHNLKLSLALDYESQNAGILLCEYNVSSGRNYTGARLLVRICDPISACTKPVRVTLPRKNFHKLLMKAARDSRAGKESSGGRTVQGEWVANA